MRALAAWICEEVRLAMLPSWEREDMTVKAAPLPCTAEDPRCAETIRRLAECRDRMRRMKCGLLDGRTVTGSASTDVKATILKARAVAHSPVHAVARKAAR